MRSPARAWTLLLAFPWLISVAPASRGHASAHASVHASGVVARARSGAARDAAPPGVLPPVLLPPPSSTPRVYTSVTAARGLCGGLARPDDSGHFLARSDVTTSFVDGHDLLARVNRSAVGGLSPAYAPDDLVNLETGASASATDCEPPGGQCLRREAADGLRELFAAMRADGHEGRVHSAFRAYAAQCGVFARWAYRDGQGFCPATEQSALAGHSQHQLGTALDLFTRAWAEAGPVFRNGFGCSAGGRWLAAHAWEHGFVLPYPLEPDLQAAGSECELRAGARSRIDARTGYRYEPWHLRFVGRASAARFHAAWTESGPGTPREITLDEWLRREAGVTGDVDLPVCDGCNCGACSTTASGEQSPCAGRSLRLSGEGAPAVSASTPAPTLEAVAVVRGGDGSRTLVAHVRVEQGTITQSTTTEPGGEADLPGAWRLAIGSPVGDSSAQSASPWTVYMALADEAEIASWDAVRTYLPARAGDVVLRYP
ncbi:MAG: M15 family metallopeptidase, partial [Deltaproteobacteria bacterium]